MNQDIYTKIQRRAASAFTRTGRKLVLTAALCLPFFMTPAGTAAAQDEAAAAAASANPYLAQIEDQAQALAESVTTPQAKNLGQIRELYGMIRSVGMVRHNVGNAVRLCGEANPYMKAGMDERYTLWNKTITGALDEQENKLKTAIAITEFDDPAAVYKYLDTLDKAAEFAEARLNKQVVTTPDSCESLQQSMDQTEDNIQRLLSNLEWPQTLETED